MQNRGRPFRPEYRSPGENLRDILEDRDIKVVEFAKRCGRPTKTISEIISGETAITPETALQFQRALIKPTAETWLNWETSFRLRLAAEKEDEKLADLYEWAKSFPYKELAKRGLISIPEDKVEFVKVILGFFGISSPSSWENLELGQERAVCYRKAKKHIGDDNSISAWLRIGTIRARDLEMPIFDEKKFKASLPAIRKLTFLERHEFEPELVEICRASGVALVIEDELPRTRLSGAARWLNKDKALIQLSTRHVFEDHFWFSFFHEAGHILEHSKKALFVDDDQGSDGDIELEADRFAINTLLPSKILDSFYDEFGRVGSKPAPHKEENIRVFAKRVGVSPGIVFGQMCRRYPKLYQSPLRKALVRKIR